MQLSQKLSQKQTLSLSPAMHQSLQVLRMSQLDLYDLVREELRSNPLLEEDENPSESLPELLPISISDLQQDILFPEEWEWDFRYTEHDLSPLLFAHREQDFSGMLQEQIGTHILPALTERIARYLVECLDERGYLEQDPMEIAEILAVPNFEVMQALYFLQSLTPTGVGARSLEECLTLQLAQSKDFNEQTLRIISSGLHLLAQNKLPAIAELIHTDLTSAQRACDAIRRLNPIPSQGYATRENTAYIIPDAVVEYSDSEISLYLNRSFVPSVTINQTYAQLLPTLCSGEEKTYIQQHLAKADTLLKSIAERNNTLQRVILCVMGLQPRFFREGSGLIPMTMADVAKRLEMSVSTVSRAVQDKYIICRRGTVSLRSLFTTGYMGEGQNAVSPDVVKEKLRIFVTAENPVRPLSDTALCEALKNVGIIIARRTVTKYREELGIPGSQKRKRWQCRDF